MLRSRVPRHRTALQRLDDRVVPVLQRGARAMARRIGAAWPVRAARRSGRAVARVVTWPFRLSRVRRIGELLVLFLGAPLRLLAGTAGSVGGRQGAWTRGERWIVTIAEVIAIWALVFAVTKGMGALVVKPFSVSSDSMVPTLSIGEQVLVDRLAPRFDEPDRGDIVVFDPPAGAADNTCGVRHVVGQACARPTAGRLNTLFIKRVVALPGDRLKVLHGMAYINGQRQSLSNIRADVAACEMCNLPREITIPPGHFFVMGDNRTESDDSRYWGPIPRDSLVGRMFFSYWPPSRFGPSSWR